METKQATQMELFEFFPKQPGRRSPIYGRPILTIRIFRDKATLYFAHEAIQFLKLEPGQRIRILATRLNPDDLPALDLWVIPPDKVDWGYTVNKSGRHTAMVTKLPHRGIIQPGHYEIMEARLNTWYPDRQTHPLTLNSLSI